MASYFGGGPKKNYTPPQNILEGNGILYGNFTLNSLILQVMSCYFCTTLFKLVRSVAAF